MGAVASGVWGVPSMSRLQFESAMTIDQPTERVACPLCMGTVPVDDHAAGATCPHCGLQFPLKWHTPEPPRPREGERGTNGEIRLASWLEDEPYEFDTKRPQEEERPSNAPAVSSRIRGSFRFGSLVRRVGGAILVVAVLTGFMFAFDWAGELLSTDAASEEVTEDVLPAEPIEVSAPAEEERVVSLSPPKQKASPEITAPPETPATSEPLESAPLESQAASRPPESPVWLLSAMAERRLKTEPKASLVFASEAARRELEKQGRLSPDVEQALRNAVAALRDAGLRFPESNLSRLALVPNGRWLAAAGESRDVYAWDLNRLRRRRNPRVLSGHRKRVTALAADPKGCLLASADAGGDIILWNLEKNDPADSPQLLSVFTDAVEHVAVNTGGTRLVAVGKEDGLSVVKWVDLTSTERLPKGLERLGEEIDCVTVDPKGGWAAVAGESKRLHVYQLRAQPPIRKRILSDHESRVTCVAALGDAFRLVSGDEGGEVRLWDLRRPKGTRPIRFLHGGGTIREVAVSPDDAWLSALAGDNSVCLWNLTEEEPQEHGIILERAGDGVAATGFAENGAHLVTAHNDGSIRVWPLSKGSPIERPTVLRGHSSPAVHIASADGWVVTATKQQAPDGTPAILFWDTDAKGLLRTAQTLLDEQVPLENRRKFLAELTGPALLR